MIFICTSMYLEAHSFIRKLDLKKDVNCCKFQIFRGKEVILMVTGIGKIKAAIALTYLFTKYKLKDSDLLINIGVCGTKDENIDRGKIFICNKIIERDTKKTFYPDMLFKHPFYEASIETCSLVIDKNNLLIEGQLVDMEASGIYQSASIFLQPHQIIFLKIVSDYLMHENLSKEYISKLVEDRTEEIIRWINTIKIGFLYNGNILCNNEERLINKVAENLRLSITMKNQLKQILIYYKLQGLDFVDIINKYISVECNSKNEGKMYLAEFRQKFI